MNPQKTFTARRCRLGVAALLLVTIGCSKSSDESEISDRQREEGAIEATTNVRRLLDSSINYYDEHATMTGDIETSQFPASVGLTPPVIPCGEGVTPQQDWWDHPTWKSLNFSTSDPQHYSYQYDSSGEGIGSTFTASAFGDLDCDGVISTFFRVGEVEEGNGSLLRYSGLRNQFYQDQPRE